MVFAYNERGRGRAASGARVLTGKRGAPLGAGPWARARWALRVNRHRVGGREGGRGEGEGGAGGNAPPN